MPCVGGLAIGLSNTIAAKKLSRERYTRHNDVNREQGTTYSFTGLSRRTSQQIFGSKTSQKVHWKIRKYKSKKLLKNMIYILTS